MFKLKYRKEKHGKVCFESTHYINADSETAAKRLASRLRALPGRWHKIGQGIFSKQTAYSELYSGEPTECTSLTLTKI